MHAACQGALIHILPPFLHLFNGDCLILGAELVNLHQAVFTHNAIDKRKEKTTPFGVNLMRSQVLYRAAQNAIRLADQNSNRGGNRLLIWRIHFNG